MSRNNFPLSNQASEPRQPVVERAQSNGIPVTIFDSGLQSENYLSFVSTNNYEAGVLAARTLAELIGNEGEIAIVKMVPGASSTMQRGCRCGSQETGTFSSNHMSRGMP